MSATTGLRGKFSGWFKPAGEKPVDILPVRVGGNEYRQTPTNTRMVAWFGAHIADTLARIGNGLVQHGGGDGLNQKGAEIRLFEGTALREHFTAMRGHHNGQRGVGAVWKLAYVVNGLPTIHLWHVPIHQNGVKRRCRVGLVALRPRGRRAGRAGRHAAARSRAGLLVR